MLLILSVLMVVASNFPNEERDLLDHLDASSYCSGWICRGGDAAAVQLLPLRAGI